MLTLQRFFAMVVKVDGFHIKTMIIVRIYPPLLSAVLLLVLLLIVFLGLSPILGSRHFSILNKNANSRKCRRV